MLAAVAAVLVACGVALYAISTHPGQLPAPEPSPSPVALSAPQMLHGTPLRPGGAPGTLLFLGGQNLQVLNVREQAPATLATLLLNSMPPTDANTNDPLGPGAAVQQIGSVNGGVVALIDSQGPAGLPDIGDVMYIPVGAHGLGTPRLVARANYMAVAPDHSAVWVEQAGLPWGNGPASSPAWLAGEDGQHLSGTRHLNGQALIADTVRGLLLQGPGQKLAFKDPVNGRAEAAGIPADAFIVAADADQMAWQAAGCSADCPVHVTNLQSGQDTQFTLPPDTVVDNDDTSDFDPSGQRLALPLDSTARKGTVVTGTYVYVADLSTGKLTRLPGGPMALVTLPADLGAFPVGSTEIVSARWSGNGSGLWIVATDGLFFQAGYWTGQGPLRVLRPQSGLAYKFELPGPST
jgi:hypothetical protein